LQFSEFANGSIPLTAGGFPATEDFVERLRAFTILDECRSERVAFGIVLLGDEGIPDGSFEALHAALGPISGDDLFD
jgi:hypothetical protein